MRIPAVGRIAIGSIGMTVLSKIAAMVGTIPARIGTVVHQERGLSEPVIRCADVPTCDHHHECQEQCGQGERLQDETDDQADTGQLGYRADRSDHHVPSVAKAGELCCTGSGDGQHDHQGGERPAQRDGIHRVSSRSGYPDAGRCC